MSQHLWKFAVGALVIVSIAASAEHLYFLKHASDRAKTACAGKHTSILDGKNAYVNCVRRVEAGGKV
jgi:hypothetical protein